MYGFGIFAKGLKPDLSFGKDNPSIDNRPTFPTIVNLKAFFIVISGRITSSFFRAMISVRFSTLLHINRFFSISPISKKISLSTISLPF